MDITQAVFAIIGANIVLLLSSIGITITLYLHTDKKLSDSLKEMRNEMKDFHGRLCSIESDRK